MKKIEIRPSVYVVIVFMFATGYGILYCLALIFAFLHELCHFSAAKYFGLKTENIVITPIGCKGKLISFNSLSLIKRCVVLAVGPLFNLTLAAVSMALGWENVMCANLALFFCNIIPSEPFDGGRIFKAVTGEIFGVLNAQRLCVKLNFLLGIAIIIFGMIQMLLYNMNISIFCLGIYVLRESRREYVLSVFEFYDAIKLKKVGFPRKVREIIMDENADLKKCFSYITLDTVLVVNICANGEIKERLTQWQIMERFKNCSY